MNAILFTIVGAALYLFSDWLLERVEATAGRRFEHRSLIFFVILMSLALTSFSLLGNITGSA
jgi:DMSO/TMAO reductase YedYZ heme-binding membrane subunit